MCYTCLRVEKCYRCIYLFYVCNGLLVSKKNCSAKGFGGTNNRFGFSFLRSLFSKNDPVFYERLLQTKHNMEEIL